jgi:hypothetical protein
MVPVISPTIKILMHGARRVLCTRSLLLLTCFPNPIPFGQSAMHVKHNLSTLELISTTAFFVRTVIGPSWVLRRLPHPWMEMAHPLYGLLTAKNIILLGM